MNSRIEVDVQTDIEAEDSLGVLLRRVSAKSHGTGVLQKQAAAIVERLAWLDNFKVIEVDGVSHAVQIRSSKPGEEGFNEVILRAGNFVSFERHGAVLHLARQQFNRLVDELTEVIRGQG